MLSAKNKETSDQYTNYWNICNYISDEIWIIFFKQRIFLFQKNEKFYIKNERNEKHYLPSKKRLLSHLLIYRKNHKCHKQTLLLNYEGL